ncbi:LPXTG cell wall anchor domain-containing protein, partial [Streptococcus mitis]|nr:LPXTG cell wall anchor domain-containing protein [Streptococcus mitis]
PAPDFPIPAKVGTPGNPPRENSDTTAVNEPALVPKTPSTPAVAPTVAGTNKDNTYQAPAAKAEDKKELPNTGGKDNVAIASLGFLGLLLGALPFVKRKN